MEQVENMGVLRHAENNAPHDEGVALKEAEKAPVEWDQLGLE